MTATYTATLYIFPQNDGSLGPIIPQGRPVEPLPRPAGSFPGGYPGSSGFSPGGPTRRPASAEGRLARPADVVDRFAGLDSAELLQRKSACKNG